jgi:hypothetical protein
MEKEKKLDVLILEKMEYTDKEPNRCVGCRFVTSVRDGYEMDLSYICVLNPVIRLEVSPAGRCKFFEKREPKS